ncbi:MAG: BMP family ABC transporter substrate-binding protein [Frankia sp.]|nr:BMP family ABC transporter substrate-binding protein [Frankia sp.]
MRFRRRCVAALAAAVALAVAGCSSAASREDSSSSSAVPGKDSTAVGFIFVGPKDDVGYNQAAYEGSQAVAEAFPDLEILTAENVPEDDNAARVMNSMIQKGAKIIFATSYGHLDAALKVAAEHPDVVVVQQGNVIAEDQITPNTGTYFGTVYEPVYLAGVAAGLTTKTNKLGYVYAFPIPQTIANIDAFTLGARSVNPEATTYTVSTSNWCDPGKQAQAAQSLLSQGIDVITQHQDCTGTIIKATEAAGAYTVGYHADGSALAPKGWITGSEWNWGPLYVDIVRTALAGEFTGSKYNANYRVGLKTGENPFVQSEFGPAVTPEVEEAVAEAAEFIASPEGSPFVGPVRDQEGTVRIPAGEVPDYATLDGIDFFVEGVIGELPKS